MMKDQLIEDVVRTILVNRNCDEDSAVQFAKDVLNRPHRSVMSYEQVEKAWKKIDKVAKNGAEWVHGAGDSLQANAELIQAVCVVLLDLRTDITNLKDSNWCDLSVITNKEKNK